MADVKISGLPASTTPLAGTEVLPIVQSGVTKKVASDDLTVKNIRSNATTGILQVAGPAAAATRVMTTPDANFSAARIDAAQSFTGDQTLSTGNLVIGTSGKGIDFSATPGTGTSELFDDYEEGTFTPTIFGSTTAGTATYTNQAGYYTKIGNVVRFHAYIDYSVHDGTVSMRIGDLPFTMANAFFNTVSINAAGLTTPANSIAAGLVVASTNQINVYSSLTSGSTNMANLAMDAQASIYVSGTYQI